MPLARHRVVEERTIVRHLVKLKVFFWWLVCVSGNKNNIRNHSICPFNAIVHPSVKPQIDGADLLPPFPEPQTHGVNETPPL